MTDASGGQEADTQGRRRYASETDRRPAMANRTENEITTKMCTIVR